MTGSPLVETTVTLGGVPFHCLQAGARGPAPPILCLHGRWGSGATWRDLMQRYAGRHRVLAPDQRGHGRSGRPADGYSTEQLAADARALLEQLDAAPAIVVGHSMGARVAGYLAALHPEVVHAVAILDETLGGAETRLGGSRDDPDDDGLTAAWPTPYPTREDAVRDLRARFPRETNVNYFLDSLVETDRGWDFQFDRRALAAIGRSYEDWRHLLARIRRPALVVRAAGSWCMPAAEARAMRDALADATLVEIAGSDHMVYADAPAAFFTALDDFLARVI